MPKPNSDCRAIERKHPWPMVRLGDVCEVISSRGHQIKQSEILPSGKYPVVSQSENPIEGFSDKEICIADVPIVLFGDHTCNVKLINDPFVVGADGTKLLKPNRHCMQYLYYCLQLLVLKLQDGKYRRHFGDLCDSEIPLPPLSIQREIVARLERELAAVEKMKKGFEALAETAKAEFKAELKEVFEEISRGGAYPPAEGCPRSGCPSRGEMRRLGEVCELCLGKMLDKAKNKGSYKPYLRNVNVRWDGFSLDDLYEMRFEDDETERYSLRKGDIVMCEGGEPGRCAVWKGEENSIMIQKALHRIRPNRATDSRYLLFAFMNLSQSGYFAERFTGTTIKHLTGQVLREVLIPLPPLPAQREVVARLDGAKAKAEKLEAKAREGVAVCETMRKAILKEAFAPCCAGEVA